MPGCPRISTPLVLPAFLLLLIACPILLAGPATAQWPLDGVTVSTQVNFDFESVLAPDGQGGAFVFYEDHPTDPTYTDLYATRIDGWGGRPWGPLLVSSVSGDDHPFAACADEAGGAFLCYVQQHNRNPSPLYVQRFRSDGTTLFPGQGIQVVEDCAQATMVADGSGGVIVFWEQYAGMENPLHYDLYAQRFDAAGTPLWSTGGVAVCTAVDYQHISDAVALPGGGAVVAWSDQRLGSGALPFVQSLDGAGVPQWGTDGLSLLSAGNAQPPVLALNPLGGVVVAWSDSRSYPGDIYVQYLGTGGTPQWIADGVGAAPGADAQSSPRIACYPDGATAVVWVEGIPAPNSLAFQVIDATGSPELTDSRGDPVRWLLEDDVYHSSLRLESDSRGGVVCTWTGNATVFEEVFAQRFVGTTAMWGVEPLLVSTGVGLGRNSALLTDPEGGSFLAFHEPGRGTAQRLDTFGNRGYPAAAVTGIEDVPGDQGGWVRVRCAASRLESWGSVPGVIGYNVWRRLTPGDAAMHPLPGGHDLASLAEGSVAPGIRLDRESARLLGLPPGTWESVGYHAAVGEPEYAFLAPTRTDSSDGGIAWEAYCVTTHTDVTGHLYTSQPDSGYSRDNLAPAAPTNVVFAGPDELGWDVAPEQDFGHHTVYGSPVDRFEDAVAVGNTSGTTFDVSAETYPYFYVTTLDRAGNESPPSGPLGRVVGIPERPSGFAMHAARPNPARGATLLSFDLSRTQRVDLAVYDVDGRRIRTLIRGTRPAGAQGVRWDGRSDSGRRVGAGIYFVRLVGEEATASRRVLFLD